MRKIHLVGQNQMEIKHNRKRKKYGLTLIVGMHLTSITMQEQIITNTDRKKVNYILAI